MYTPPDVIAATCLSLVMAAAVCTDVRSRRIPNRLTYAAMAFMLAYSTASQGLAGFSFSAGGLLLGAALLLPVYMIGGMGAGDAKLMGVAGAALGPRGVFTAFLFTALAGGLYALIRVMLDRGRSGALVKRWALMLKCLAVSFRFTYIPAPQGTQAAGLCYAIPIATGSAAALAWHAAYSSYLI